MGTWEKFTRYNSIIFISALVSFYIGTLLSIRSLQKFKDAKCPQFLDYFHADYINKQMNCYKYTQVGGTLEELKNKIRVSIALAL